MSNIPYAVEHQRQLSEEERNLVSFLLENEAPQYLSQLASLLVIDRCGCGKCPTIMFGSQGHEVPEFGEFTKLADYIGKADDGVLVGVMLFERNGVISELEAWSPAGEDIRKWPAIENLARID